MSDRHLLHEFMSGRTDEEFARTDRMMLTIVDVGIGAMVALAIGQWFL